jgi:hypothetical protein
VTNVGSANGDPSIAASQPPVDEEQGTPCSGILSALPTRQSEAGQGGRLGPWILPSPDAAPERVTDACISELLTQGRRCPSSVMLCLDQVSECTCGSAGGFHHGLLPHANSGNIDCGPDGSYNPGTGTCGGHNGAFPPTSDFATGHIRCGPAPSGSATTMGGPCGTPPIVVTAGGPAQIRAGFTGTRLWSPTNATPNLLRWFGSGPPNLR